MINCEKRLRKGEKKMKKVLILAGSPRMHGNSNTLCEEFVEF